MRPMANRISASELFSKNLTALARSMSVSRSMASYCREEGQPEIAKACEEWVALMEHFIHECGLDEEYQRAERVIEEQVGKHRRLHSGTIRGKREK
jgi:hypothetical protein